MRNLLLDKTWAALDIGTTKICVLVARFDKQGAIEILGFGQHPSYGLKKGVVVDITSTVESIKKAVKAAEHMAGVTIDSATVGISGGHIQSVNSQGVVAVKKRDISQHDIDRVIEAAKAIPIPEDREILHVLPQYFRVDGQELVRDSLGMYGVRLEAQVHIITGAISSANNIIKCCEMAGIKVDDIVLEQLASAEAVLTPSERDLGVGILDIGGGTSDFAIYKDGRIRHSKVIPMGGNHFTNDLSIGMKVPVALAEQLKRSHGFVLEEKYLELNEAKVQVELGYEGMKKEIDAYRLYEILSPRAQEILDVVLDELVEYTLKPFMPFGLVLTGGGSLLRGVKELAEQMYDMPVRIGLPQGLTSNHQEVTIPDVLKSPIYATAYGLLLYAVEGKDLTIAKSVQDPTFRKVFKRMRSWIFDFV